MALFPLMGLRSKSVLELMESSQFSCTRISFAIVPLLLAIAKVILIVIVGCAPVTLVFQAPLVHVTLVNLPKLHFLLFAAILEHILQLAKFVNVHLGTLVVIAVVKLIAQMHAVEMEHALVVFAIALMVLLALIAHVQQIAQVIVMEMANVIVEFVIAISVLLDLLAKFVFQAFLVLLLLLLLTISTADRYQIAEDALIPQGAIGVPLLGRVTQPIWQTLLVIRYGLNALFSKLQQQWLCPLVPLLLEFLLLVSSWLFFTKHNSLCVTRELGKNSTKKLRLRKMIWSTRETLLSVKIHAKCLTQRTARID